MARTPLMAGNWKMNLDHLEANHLVQGLAMALSDAGHDYSKCEVHPSHLRLSAEFHLCCMV